MGWQCVAGAPGARVEAHHGVEVGGARAAQEVLQVVLDLLGEKDTVTPIVDEEVRGGDDDGAC